MPVVKKMKMSEIYNESGLIYIRFDASIEDKPSGQRKIGGSRPAFSQIEKQPTYGPGDGRYYSLLMGREFKPGRFAVLLDFDNKAEAHTMNGLELIKKLDIDQYKAPKQATPSGGFHYVFYVDEAQRARITSKTTIMHKGVKYNMDVKFSNGLCNCAPSKIDGYGEYKWLNPYQLLDIPKLPDELFDMIANRQAKAVAGSEGDRQVAAGQREVGDMRALCACLSVAQLDDYHLWSGWV